MATKWFSTRTVSPLLLLTLAAFAAADEPKDADKSRARVSVNKAPPKCEPAPAILSDAGGAIGVGGCKDGSETRVVVEKDMSVKLAIKQKPTTTCAATVDVEYEQRNTLVHVTGAIENNQCAASGGDYVLAVTIIDAKGESTTLEFPEVWTRKDAEPVKFTFDLPIGPNVDLKNVRTRQVRCTCTETAAEK